MAAFPRRSILTATDLSEAAGEWVAIVAPHWTVRPRRRLAKHAYAAARGWSVRFAGE